VIADRRSDGRLIEAMRRESDRGVYFVCMIENGLSASRASAIAVIESSPNPKHALTAIRG
jgi:hypothetical protein